MHRSAELSTSQNNQTPAHELNNQSDNENQIREAEAALDNTRRTIHDRLGADGQELKHLLDEYVVTKAHDTIGQAQADGHISHQEQQEITNDLTVATIHSIDDAIDGQDAASTPITKVCISRDCVDGLGKDIAGKHKGINVREWLKDTAAEFMQRRREHASRKMGELAVKAFNRSDQKFSQLVEKGRIDINNPAVVAQLSSQFMQNFNVTLSEYRQNVDGASGDNQTQAAYPSIGKAMVEFSSKTGLTLEQLAGQPGVAEYIVDQIVDKSTSSQLDVGNNFFLDHDTASLLDDEGLLKQVERSIKQNNIDINELTLAALRGTQDLDIKPGFTTPSTQEQINQINKYRSNIQLANQLGFDFTANDTQDYFLEPYRGEARQLNILDDTDNATVQLVNQLENRRIQTILSAIDNSRGSAWLTIDDLVSPLSHSLSEKCTGTSAYYANLGCWGESENEFFNEVRHQAIDKSIPLDSLIASDTLLPTTIFFQNCLDDIKPAIIMDGGIPRETFLRALSPMGREDNIDLTELPAFAISPQNPYNFGDKELVEFFKGNNYELLNKFFEGGFGEVVVDRCRGRITYRTLNQLNHITHNNAYLDELNETYTEAKQHYPGIDASKGTPQINDAVLNRIVIDNLGWDNIGQIIQYNSGADQKIACMSEAELRTLSKRLSLADRLPGNKIRDVAAITLRQDKLGKVMDEFLNQPEITVDALDKLELLLSIDYDKIPNMESLADFDKIQQLYQQRVENELDHKKVRALLDGLISAPEILPSRAADTGNYSESLLLKLSPTELAVLDTNIHDESGSNDYSDQLQHLANRLGTTTDKLSGLRTNALLHLNDLLTDSYNELMAHTLDNIDHYIEYEGADIPVVVYDGQPFAMLYHGIGGMSYAPTRDIQDALLDNPATWNTAYGSPYLSVSYINEKNCNEVFAKKLAFGFTRISPRSIQVAAREDVGSSERLRPTHSKLDAAIVKRNIYAKQMLEPDDLVFSQLAQAQQTSSPYNEIVINRNSGNPNEFNGRIQPDCIVAYVNADTAQNPISERHLEAAKYFNVPIVVIHENKYQPEYDKVLHEYKAEFREYSKKQMEAVKNRLTASTNSLERSTLYAMLAAIQQKINDLYMQKEY